MTVGDSWTCPGCARALSTPYCAQCGEQARDPRDLTLRGLAVQILHAFSSVDGKVLRSLRRLVTRPGALSVAFEQGQRLPYVGPFQLFLLANVVFFAVQSLTHANIFSSTLESHLHGQDWSRLARSLVERRLETLHTTLEEFAPRFDRAVVLHAKSLVVLMVVPFALLLPLVYRRAKPFAAHAVFALHLFAFLLLLFCVSLSIFVLDERTGGVGLASPHMDTVLTLLNLGACAAYLFVALGVFYRASLAVRALQTIGLTLAVGGIVLGYRFALFLITLYTT